jgi:AcrR family transcriptional regulator
MGIGMKSAKSADEMEAAPGRAGSLRADAQRSADALVQAARELFSTRGLDVTTREIASLAGVGMGTLYRRFPRRADLVGAVFQRELDALADASVTLAKDHPPFEALARWTQLYVDLLATKRGLAKAVRSDDPVYVGMAAQFEQRLHPAARSLYEAALVNGDVRSDLDAVEMLAAVSALCMSPFDGRPDHAGRMVAIFMAGLRMAD